MVMKAMPIVSGVKLGMFYDNLSSPLEVELTHFKCKGRFKIYIASDLSGIRTKFDFVDGLGTHDGDFKVLD